ncbi:hypothetical protein PSTG_18261, partial [Puccinia striiformis f. sp. tritici PST-78]
GVAARVADGNRGLTLVDARGGQEFQQQLLASFGRLAENSNRQAVILTADKGAQTQLRSALGKSASAVMTAAELADQPLAGNSLLVISEAERFSVPMMQAALQAADRAGTPAVVIDTHARRTTGFAAEVLKAAGTPVHLTTQNREQSRLTLVAVHDGVLIEAKSALDTAIEKGQLIAVDKNQTLFTSAAHVRDEHRLAATAGRLAEREASLTRGTG